jgi:hypothetical protein
MDIAKILSKNGYVGWEVVNNKITKWPEGVEKPTEKQLAEWWKEIKIELERESIRQEREARYRAEADGLFFKWQAGEIEKEVWLAARERIKKELPKT